VAAVLTSAAGYGFCLADPLASPLALRSGSYTLGGNLIY